VGVTLSTYLSDGAAMCAAPAREPAWLVSEYCSKRNLRPVKRQHLRLRADGAERGTLQE